MYIRKNYIPTYHFVFYLFINLLCGLSTLFFFLEGSYHFWFSAILTNRRALIEVAHNTVVVNDHK